MIDYVQYVNLALYTLVALVAIRLWRLHRESAALWAALTFAALAIVIDAGPLIPEGGRAAEIGSRLLIALLVVFPFLLYRFAISFRPPSRRLELLVSAMTTVMLAWTFLLPSLPEEGEPRPGWLQAYVIGFLIHWTLLTVVVSHRLWRAGRGEASVARRRMYMLAFGAATITIALIVAAADPTEDSVADAVTALLSTASAVSFLLGLAPPAWLRALWRRPEQERLQTAVTDLMRASTSEEVLDRVLPAMADVVGARAVEMHDADGRPLGSTGEPRETTGRVSRVAVPSGESLVVHTSPYAPYFGGEELALVRTLGALTVLALDRTRLFAQERDARRALEQADELKTNFVALAAHELRTPAATIHGLAETIHSRREALRPDQLNELQDVLHQQTTRLRGLVEQLLDLSRLDAEAIPIAPQPLRVRDRIEEVVVSAAAGRAREVDIDVERDLVADIDPNAFDRIVSNLIVNALRYGEPPVRVSAVQNDRHFRLSVEDCGHGVAPEFVPDLFERFTRSDRARERIGGTGLGLAIARSYAQAHRGDLIYEPAQPQGARFELVLPVERSDVHAHRAARWSRDGGPSSGR